MVSFRPTALGRRGRAVSLRAADYRILLNARIDTEKVKPRRFRPIRPLLLPGAEVYRDQCAACHGFHSNPRGLARICFRGRPQLWEKHGNSDVVGVSDDPPGETYWKVANGIRLTGMPSYKKILTDSGDVAGSAAAGQRGNKPLPPAALHILNGKAAPGVPSTAADAMQKGRAAAPRRSRRKQAIVRR